MKFEQSKFDNDKGVKEGSKADLKRDAKEKKAMPKKLKAAAGMMAPAMRMTKDSGVSAKESQMAALSQSKGPSRARNQMVKGPGMPRLNKGGMMRGR